MNQTQTRRLTGLLFILGALLVNVPYALLIANFSYPDILREPTGDILTQFQAGGAGLVYTWLAFAWLGLPMIFAIILLDKVLGREDTPYLRLGTAAGVVGGVAQVIGLLRWVFVVPVLARVYTDPASSDAAREAAAVSFQVIHQYGGVVIGEHIGQIFTIIWMLLASAAILSSGFMPKWLAWFGFVTSFIYFLAQTELLATAIPDVPQVPEAGMIGSMLWLLWMIILGILLLRRPRAMNL